MSDSVLQIRCKKDYDRIISENKRVVIFYGAPWCDACEQMHDIYNRIAARYKKRISLAYVDIDRVGFELQTIPQFVAYHKKEAIDHLEGATVDGLKELVKTAITYTPPFSGKD